MVKLFKVNCVDIVLGIIFVVREKIWFFSFIGLRGLIILKVEKLFLRICVNFCLKW